MTKDSSSKELQLGKSRVRYYPDSGEFRWVLAYRKPSRTGMLAAIPRTNGYLYIKANQSNYSASRLAWNIVYGVIPDGMEIDHINRNRADNRIANLRIVNRKQNLANRCDFKPNRVGVLGVSIHKKTSLFRARYRNAMAYFKTKEEAAACYSSMRGLAYAELGRDG